METYTRILEELAWRDALNVKYPDFIQMGYEAWDDLLTSNEYYFICHNIPNAPCTRYILGIPIESGLSEPYGIRYSEFD